jgi:preprotein translocase subunit SecE
MASQQVEVVASTADRVKLAAAILLVVAGLVAFYGLVKQPVAARVGVLLVGLAGGIALGLFSGPGQRLIAFGRDSWSETRRVVWPTRKETTQVTLVVFGFVVAMAIFLWVVDKSLEWVLYDLLLGWKK